eukprot:3322586-Rhodomonas_salina.1
MSSTDLAYAAALRMGQRSCSRGVHAAYLLAIVLRICYALSGTVLCKREALSHPATLLLCAVWYGPTRRNQTQDSTAVRTVYTRTVHSPL